MSAGQSAKDLLERLLGAPNARDLSSEFLEEVGCFFDARGDAARARWMRLEREGYGARTEATNLRDVLGSDAPNDVVEAVLGSRRHYGRVVVGGVERRWPHFFVESVEELRRWEQRVSGRNQLTVEVELDIPLAEPGPRALSFPRSIFGQVLTRLALDIGVALQQMDDR